MSEQQIQKTILNYLKELDQTYSFKVIVANRKGIPDIIVCYKGRFIAFEVKTTKGKATELQKLNLRQIEDAGGKAYVVRSVEEVKECLAKLS